MKRQHVDRNHVLRCPSFGKLLIMAFRVLILTVVFGTLFFGMDRFFMYIVKSIFEMVGL